MKALRNEAQSICCKKTNPFRRFQEGQELQALLDYIRTEVGLLGAVKEITKLGITSFLPYFGLPPIGGPVYVGVDFSYRCNARCVFCDRWKQQSTSRELSTQEILDLSNQLKEAGTHIVVIAGGEPTLMPDLPLIIRSFHDKGIKTAICTNGARLEERADELIAAGLNYVTASVDGLPESHDKLRGVKGLYDKAERGVKKLLEKRSGAGLTVNVRMLIHEGNIGEIDWFMEHWNHVADSCLLQPIHNGENNFYKTGEVRPITSIDRLRTALAKTGLAKNFFNQSMTAYLENPSKFQRLPCYAGYLVGRIDPFGNVFGCVEQIERVGNIRESSFAEIWKSERFNQARKKMCRSRQCRCFYNDNFSPFMWSSQDKIPLVNKMIRSRFNGDSIMASGAAALKIA